MSDRNLRYITPNQFEESKRIVEERGMCIEVVVMDSESELYNMYNTEAEDNE